MNLADVRAALHIPAFLRSWIDCNDNININYNQQYSDMTPIFEHFINSGYPLNILIYNGDVDTACQFLGDEWMIENLAKIYRMKTSQKRIPWTFQSERGGYWKQFKSPVGTIDLVTIKGAGHFVPLDRPGPSLQMLYNFITGSDYLTPLPFSAILTPLKQEYEILERIAAIGETAHERKKRSLVANRGSAENDKIVNLNGLTFTPDFEQYSGFLQYQSENTVHYWLIESKKQSNAPLIIWLGDGPGCSVLYDAVIDLGPYRLNAVGTIVYQNPYSWNQVANLLFLETIPGAGFSPPTQNQYNDSTVTLGITSALSDFFDRFPNFKQSNVYLFGKGYGSIYALNLAEQIAQETALEGINLVGLGLVNSLLSHKNIINTIPNELYFSALIGKEEWDTLIPCCTVNGVYDNECDLSQYVTVTAKGTITPNKYENPTKAHCAQLVSSFVNGGLNERIGPGGNFYRSCYEGITTDDFVSKKSGRMKRQAGHLDDLPLTNLQGFVNQENRMNYRSTDAFASYPCYMNYAATLFFNNETTQKSMHINNAATWQSCSSVNYIHHNVDMTSVLKSLLSTNLHIIVIDGDSHLVNNFLANEYFVDNFAKQQQLSEQAKYYAWTYALNSSYLPQYAGFVKSYAKNNMKLDYITVKGGGQHTMLDRPAPTRQLISNYLNNANYNNTVAISSPLPLNTRYEPVKPHPVSQQAADQIYNLPGLTYSINFDQYAGYLPASKGNYLHYWFVKSQNVPDSDPVLIWFTGGPGCSSLGALLTENGPFHVNPDGRTLFENVFSWNKLANVLYIESPRMVGFSYQDKSVNPSMIWNDTYTAKDAYLAIKYFFTEVFPTYASHDIYITGESYGGVYVPTLTALLIKEIQEGNLKINLTGMAVGNGYLSALQDVRSVPNYMYFHGIYGEDTWNELQDKCCKSTDNLPTTQCPFEKFVQIDSSGAIYPRSDQPGTTEYFCGNLITELAYYRVWGSMNYVYDIYQDCYHQTRPILDLGAESDRSWLITRKERVINADKHREQTVQHMLKGQEKNLKPNMGIAYMKAFPWKINTVSTDHDGGFACYMTYGATSYLNQDHVKKALHVPDYVDTPWSFCTDMVSDNYHKEYNDTTSVFQQMIDSNYPLRILIYNGDVDTACSMFEAEWFIEAFAKKNNMPYTPRGPWLYQLSSQFSPQIGGYYKRFHKLNLTIDLLTVKGAGHMVPTDRAGPALQMLTNFVRQQNYNDVSPFSYERQPLLPQYQ